MIPAITMRDITVRYGPMVANDAVDLAVQPGEMHAVVGENGAGKTTLMHVLCGLVRPDTGTVCVDGRVLPPGRPDAALDAGVGLVAQHFSLIPPLSVWENVVLGCEPVRWGCLERRKARAQTADLVERLGVSLPVDAPVESLPLGVRQIVEIAKALYRRARILILDEPTSALSPPEADRLFTLVTRLRDDGTTVLLVTHRIREVQAHATRATVLRRGRIVRTFDRDDFDAGTLVQAIVGSREDGASPAHRNGSSVPFSASRKGAKAQRDTGTMQGRPLRSETLLQIERLDGPTGTRASLDSLTLAVHRSEILGIAGVAGNGQQALVRAVTGLSPVRAGRIVLNGRDITRDSVAARRAAGLGFIPEDRHVEGMIPGFSIRDNLLLGSQRRHTGVRGLDFNAVTAHAMDLIARFDIRCEGPHQLAHRLSGGNQQKMVVARELSRRPDLILAVQPTRGLDIRAAAFVHRQLMDVRARSGGVLLISSDLEELMALSDRIAVLYRGRAMGVQSRETFDSEALGRMMTGVN